MSVLESLTFDVSVRWRGGSLTVADTPTGEELAVSQPPELPGGLPECWTPEDLLVTAVASCFCLTLVGVAEHRDVPLLDAIVRATGRMGRRADGGVGFVRIDVDAELETLPGSEDDVVAAAGAAERRCLVARALSVPVHVSVDARSEAPFRPLAAAIR
jgi:organic hydroperoxide reductase OsmC/OhrA